MLNKMIFPMKRALLNISLLTGRIVMVLDMSVVWGRFTTEYTTLLSKLVLGVPRPLKCTYPALKRQVK
jgi:hypothetical protein